LIRDEESHLWGTLAHFALAIVENPISPFWNMLAWLNHTQEPHPFIPFRGDEFSTVESSPLVLMKVMSVGTIS